MPSQLHQLKQQYACGAIAKAAFIEQMHARFHISLFDYAEELADTDIARIEIVASEVLMTSRRDGLRIAVDAQDHRTAPIEILNFGQYEPEETGVIRHLAPQIDVMLDIGANIGWYSLLVAKINPKATIHSFEPIPSTYQRLLRNFALNQCDSGRCHNFGFASTPGSSPFYFYPEGSGNASMRNLANRVDAIVIDCELRTLDSMVEQLEDGQHVDFIKCDVEGNELFVFQGGMALLEHHKPVLLVELLRKWSASFGYHPNKVLDLLADIGYKPYTITTDGSLQSFPRITEETSETNFFFVHSESRLNTCLAIR